MQVGSPVGAIPEGDAPDLGVQRTYGANPPGGLLDVLSNIQEIYRGKDSQYVKEQMALSMLNKAFKERKGFVPRVVLVDTVDGVQLVTDGPVDVIEFNFAKDDYVAPKRTPWTPMAPEALDQFVRATKSEHDAEYGRDPMDPDDLLGRLTSSENKSLKPHEVTKLALAARDAALYGEGTHEDAARANRKAAAVARDAVGHAANSGDKKILAQRAREHEEIAADHDRMAREVSGTTEVTPDSRIGWMKGRPMVREALLGAEKACEQREDLRAKLIDLQVRIGDLIPPIEGERANDPMIRRVERQTALVKTLEAKVKTLDEAATNLVRTFVNGTHYGTQNPYSRAAVKAAMMALAETHGRNPDNWMDAVNGGKDEVLKGLPEGIHPRNRAVVETALEGEREVFVLKSSPDTFAALVEAVVAEGEGVTDDGFVVIKDGFKNPMWGHAWTESMGLDSARYIKRLPEPYVKKALAREEKFKG